jgi:hypothetical protein
MAHLWHIYGTFMAHLWHIYGIYGKLLPAAHAIYTPGNLELASIDKSGVRT